MSATAKLYRRGQWSQDEDGTENVTDVWEVTTTSETDTISTVVTATGIPAKGASHPEKTSAIVVNRAAKQDDEVLTRWLLDISYSTKITTREDQPYASQRVKGGMRSSSIAVPAFYDSRGYPLVNTAGDLYEGLTRKVRTRTVNVTYNSTTIPTWLFGLSDTINDAAVTILGETYPAGTCLLKDVEVPDEPERDPAGSLYYPVTYTVEINPMGWFILLPNKGANELVYQTRTGATAAWVDVTKATYDGKSPTTDRQIIKRPIQSTEQMQLAGDIWLDANGQATKVPTLATTQLGTGGMTAGSATLTLATGSFSTTNHVGALVRVKDAGPKGHWLDAQITAVASSSSATLAIKASSTVSGKAVYLSGVIVNQFVLEDLADWTSVPLPNNQP